MTSHKKYRLFLTAAMTLAFAVTPLAAHASTDDQPESTTSVVLVPFNVPLQPIRAAGVACCWG